MKQKAKAVSKLKKAGFRATPQRIAILQLLYRDVRWHPTADTIYHELKRRFPSLSPAALYSSLQTLKKAGLIQELSIRRDRVSYDPIPLPHHHFYCEQCGRIFNINITCPIADRRNFNGNRVNEVQAYFYGICSNCS
jgi:Fur family peroxide stress response transcriptional regulator